MSRPIPLHVTLSQLAAESREKIAADVLALSAVRDAASKAALQGLNSVTIPLGPAHLGSTKAAQQLVSELKGMQFEWLEVIERDGNMGWSLRLRWSPTSA